ncbi:sodium:solute symporter [Adhaeretor mobilis]|nr:sodium/solute symporter [Adhaeretor mobilis]
MGGRDNEGNKAGVYLLTWNSVSEQIDVDQLGDMPKPLAMCSAARLGDQVFLAGCWIKDAEQNETKKQFLSLKVFSFADLEASQWQHIKPWPGQGYFFSALTAQNGKLFLLNGSSTPISSNASQSINSAGGSYCFSSASQSWSRLTDPPIALAASSAIAYGPSTILYIGGIGNDAHLGGESAASESIISSKIFAHETITDSWSYQGKLTSPIAMATAVEWQGRIVVAGGHTTDNLPTSSVAEATVKPWQSAFHFVDYTMLALYLLVLMYIGWHFSEKGSSSSDYMLGGQTVPWWAVGLSIMATQVSSIGFMAIPAKAFATDWVYFTGILTWFIVVPIVVRYYIPFFYRPNVTTAYEYLEHRFNLAVRLYGSLSFILLQLGRMAVVLYLPALALSVVTGMNVYASILIMGILSTAYTVMGGINAVIWTDVLQAGVLMGGALLGMIIAVMGLEDGIEGFLNIAEANNKFRLINWDTNITTTAIWVVLVGNVFQRTSDLTADQTVVQRYLSTKNIQQASRALWANVAASIPWALIVFLFGTALFAFFKTHPEKLNPAMQTDAIVPWFVVEYMPVGISGLVLAALFAAAMSSLDSSIHSVATTISIDFYKRFRSDCSDRDLLRLARRLTGVLGMLGTGAALLAATYEIDSLWDLFLEFAGLAIGGLAGIFMLGIFTKRGNSLGAISGAIVGAVVLYSVKTYTHIHFFLYPALGVGSSFLIGYAVSILYPSENQSLAGLTIHTNDAAHDSPFSKLE